MAKNWLIYILALIGTITFFLFYQMWLAWYCLVLLLLIPPLALFIALVSRRGSSFSIVSPKSVKIGDEAILKIKVMTRRIATFSIVKMEILITERMTEEKTRKRAFVQGSAIMEIPIETKHCGSFHYELDKIRVYDPFGLFGFRAKKKASSEVVIHPVPQIPEAIPRLNGFKAKTLRRSNSPYSEIYDVRDYVAGDPIKNIHWKASAKKDALMIKEPQEECYGHARVFLTLAEDRDTFDRKMGEVLFTSNYFLSRDIPHKIRVLPPMRREIGFDIQSQRDLDTAILRILHMRIPKETADAKKD
ncbi:MAG: DUF58 domain-containing protein [Clostridiales bacterium]|nr:DUF58 domain-containing protein [Clostridiales bacterium]